jgi:AAA domain
MNDLKKQKIKACCQQWIDSKGISQNNAAHLIGVAPAVLTFLKQQENWGKISDEMFLKIAYAVGYSEGWQVSTQAANFNLFKNCCITAKKHCQTIMIAAHTGAGKTTAVQFYRNSYSSVHYVHCENHLNTRDLVIKIAKALGIQGEGKTADLVPQIVGKLTSTEDNLLIIDSMHRLNKAGTFEFIGDLAEQLEHKAGLLLVGTEVLADKIEKGLHKSKVGYSELDRRIYKRIIQRNKSDEALSDTEITQICQLNDISERSQILQVIKGIRDDDNKAVADYLGVCKNYGDVRKRILYFQLKNKREKSNADNQPAA